MCAIAGIWTFDSRTEPGVIERFANSMRHRGPDGFGFHEEPQAGLWLGHRRLSILDLSDAGKQPMASPDGRYWITYNGEIFNFLELRDELARFGHQFASDSDTEIILAAYRQWGPDCQLKFNGMWAFAIWDRAKSELFISRDRFGIKPLYYIADGKRFCFASELKAFLWLEGFEARENTEALAAMLRNVAAIEPTTSTLLQGVKKLRAGHCMTVRSGRVEERRWWNTLEHLPGAPATFEEHVERFRELFLDACKLRLRSDVPVATCLSGGLDSSSVLCSLAALKGQAERAPSDWQSAFVASFPGATQDETGFARIAIEHARARGHFREFERAELLSTLARTIYDFEEVSTTMPAPVWAIYKAVKDGGATVSLDGHGADELLAGYIRYRSAALRESGGLIHPRRTMKMVHTFQALYSEDGPQDRPGTFELFAEADPFLRFFQKQRKSLSKRLRRASSKPGGGHDYKRWLLRKGAAGLDEISDAVPFGGVNRELYHDFHYARLPAILRNFDRCSMAHGVEVRMPFMDWRLVTFVFSLPLGSKLGGGYTKRVLREAMRGILPEPIRTRTGKIGFNSPLPEWFGAELKSWLLDTVEEPDFVNSDLWRGAAVRDFVRERSRAGGWTWSESSHVWTLVHAHLWRKMFLRKAGAP